MGRPRKFDWDEAARLYAETKNYSEVARRLGVAMPSVARAVNPAYREHCAQYQREQKPYMGTCVDCGGPATKVFNYADRGGRCTDCFAKLRATSVREDTLRCGCCRLWLPDEAFPRQAASKSRRQRHSMCTPCARVVKRDQRAAMTPEQRDRENARKRASRARLRAAS